MHLGLVHTLFGVRLDLSIFKGRRRVGSEGFWAALDLLACIPWMSNSRETDLSINVHHVLYNECYCLYKIKNGL